MTKAAVAAFLGAVAIPGSAGSVALPHWLPAAEKHVLDTMFEHARPLHTGYSANSRTITVVWEFDRVVVCGGCSAPDNASLPRGRVIRVIFDRKTHRLTGPLQFCESKGDKPPIASCLRVVANAVAGGATRPSSASAQMAAIEKNWRAHLRSGARSDPKRRFANPSRSTLDARLRLAARRYDFRVVSLRVLRPLQAAPLVVVETADEQALAASTPAILALLDPKARTSDDRAGWAYEGFLFEARNALGVPFLATFNWWRGPHAGGGQWAAQESLYPFAHG